MGRKLTPKELKLYERCDEVLHYVWDPIGVAGVPVARDEYGSYLDRVFGLLVNGGGESQIVDYLASVESRYMGLAPNRALAKRVAMALIEWRDWIAEQTL